MENEQKNLSADVKILIQEYIWKTLAAPAAIVAVLIGLGGYAAKSIIDSSAIEESHRLLTETTGKVNALLSDVNINKYKTDILLTDSEKIFQKINRREEENQSLLPIRAEILTNLNSTAGNVAKLLAEDNSFKNSIIDITSKATTELGAKIARIGVGTAATVGTTGARSGIQHNTVSCPAGQYVSGVLAWGAPGSVRYCVGCFHGLELICKPFVTQ